MEPPNTKQREINLKRVEIAESYPTLWSHMISEWTSPSEEDRAWLMYSANYLLRTGNVRWAIDPLLLGSRVALAPKMQIKRDLEGLAFVLLTHQHADHLDTRLLYDLRDLPICWIIPFEIMSRVQSRANLPEERIHIPRAFEPIEIEGIRIVPFDGLHGEIPAMAYMVEFGGKRWLFPGDIRRFDSTRLPSFGTVDGVFAHLWLGKGCALEEKPALLDQFCHFYLKLKPGRIVVTHLEELGRLAEDYWDRGHFLLVEKWFREHAAYIHIECAMMGDRISF